MQPTTHCIVLVTAPDMKVARSIARGALEKRLVACANLVPKIESHYWWQGQIEKSSEVLIMFKAPQLKLRPLERHVHENHPYDTPEFLVVSLNAGSERYLKWIGDSVK